MENLCHRNSFRVYQVVTNLSRCHKEWLSFPVQHYMILITNCARPSAGTMLTRKLDRFSLKFVCWLSWFLITFCSPHELAEDISRNIIAHQVLTDTIGKRFKTQSSVWKAINSLRLSDTYINLPSLVQIMPCHLVNAKPLSEPMM